MRNINHYEKQYIEKRKKGCKPKIVDLSLYEKFPRREKIRKVSDPIVFCSHCPDGYFCGSVSERIFLLFQVLN